MSESWNAGVDPLGDALHFLHMSGVFYCRCELTQPWGLELPPFGACMVFHVVTSGEALLEVEGTEGRVLRTGELALVTRGEGHKVLSAAGVGTRALFELPREQLSDRYEVLRLGGGGAPASMICGVVRFEHPAAHELIRLLPRQIAVGAWSSHETEWLQTTLRFMLAEARELRAGGDTVITRLADILVVQAIRGWIARDPAAQTGWLGALRDPQIGRAIALVHREPSRVWDLQSLATAAGMSRSAFAARFTELVGEPAMHYVTRWRMQVAEGWLAENQTVSQVTARLGYESEAAFSRAFKRITGTSPGSVRRRRR